MLLKYCFELTLVIDADKFDKLMDRACNKSKGEYQSDNDKYVDHALASKGITIAYHDNSKETLNKSPCEIV